MPEYFKRSEFACKCGCGLERTPHDLWRMINAARGIAGVPFVINSGTRCRVHNLAEGGSPTSSHRPDEDGWSWAADIRALGGSDREAIVRGLIVAGFRRIGIAQSFVHVDCDPHKTPSIWLY
jgi:hypothetical protein